MSSILKFLLLLSLILWLGGILFFATAVAPSLFAFLTPLTGGRVLAGNIVGQLLTTLHLGGLICGLVFLLCSTILSRKFRRASNYLVLAMLALTAISQFAITPRIAAIRAESGQLDRLSMDEARRMQFDRLHRLSTMTEGGVLLLGLGVVGTLSRKLNP
jgi:hypothetical protein